MITKKENAIISAIELPRIPACYPKAFADDEKDGGEQPTKFENAGSSKKYSSRDEIMKIKSAKERQAAIAENYPLFQ